MLWPMTSAVRGGSERSREDCALRRGARMRLSNSITEMWNIVDIR